MKYLTPYIVKIKISMVRCTKSFYNDILCNCYNPFNDIVLPFYCDTFGCARKCHII